MVQTAILVAVLTMAVACSSSKTAHEAPPPDMSEELMGDIVGTGTIRFQEIEGGFYGIVADNGARYDPGTLERSFQKDGMRVSFVLRERRGVMSIRMWGRIVEVVRLEKI